LVPLEVAVRKVKSLQKNLDHGDDIVYNDLYFIENSVLKLIDGREPALPPQ